MKLITTALEMIGALVVILGVCALLAPVVGVGWCLVIGGVCLIGLSALVEWVRQ